MAPCIGRSPVSPVIRRDTTHLDASGRAPRTRDRTRVDCRPARDTRPGFAADSRSPDEGSDLVTDPRRVDDVVTKLGDIAAGAGLRRITMLAWRDLDGWEGTDCCRP